jgi:CheY-like chemotaxis protein
MTRVLVVDDEPQILRALRINLRARRYDVNTAASGAQALEEAAAHPPDLVILDLGLPDMDGVEVIGGLRGWTKVPIIVLSGRADSSDKVEALDAGADDYVTKPFGMDELLARMRAAVRRTPAAEAPPKVSFGNLTIDMAAKRVIRDGAGGTRDRSSENGAAADADPQSDGDIRLSAAAEPGQTAQPPAAAERGVGARVRQRGRQPAALHGATAPQAGARPGAAAVADHRAGDGVPLPAAAAGSGSLRSAPEHSQFLI